MARQDFTGPHVWDKGEYHAGCSKRPDFSPAQPWRAKTRLVPSKAAASEEARRTLRYVEPLSDVRTPLADFFSILLEGSPGGANQI
jgi:hypothetical protein